MNNIFLTTSGSELYIQPNGRIHITLTAKENGNDAVEKQWADVDDLRVTATIPAVSGAVRLPIAINGSMLEIAGYQNEWRNCKVMIIGNLGGVPFEYSIVLNVGDEYQNRVSAIVEIPALDAGGAGGCGAESMVETTWAELKAKRDNGELIAGQQYRITDYVATTIDLESRSANHPFDVIVTADSANVLNENARAIAHAGDTYFEKCDLSAWQLKYSIDNDVNRWTWAQEAFEGYLVNVGGEASVNATLESSEDTTYDGYPYRLSAEFMGDSLLIYSSTLESSEFVIAKISIGGGVQDMPITISHVQTEAGKGVIFQMIDENNNNMQYDFKGIQFKRYKITACDKSPSLVGTWAAAQHSDDITIDADDFRWCYLFNVMFDDDNKDDSVGFYGGTPVNCTNLTSIVLPNGVCNIDGNDNPLSCHSWTCGNQCFSWTCCNDCHSWTCGNQCHSWTCGNQCHSWTCGNGCDSWTCGNGCYSWDCGNSCYSWTCGNGCRSWTCGNDSSSWTCGDGCYSWTCGDVCDSWTCGNSCYYWTCGNDCDNWTCGDSCVSWTCGDNCSRWTCGNNGLYFTLLANTYSSAATLPIVSAVSYVQYVGKNSQGVVKVWCPADLVTT